MATELSKEPNVTRKNEIEFETKPATPVHSIRFVTASSLFDGHDASINIMRRILQAAGVEVIHLGHNRSVLEIVDTAIQEDVQGIAISSYQGGHVQFFKYMIDLLREKGASHIRVFGGGGGVIIPSEIEELEAYGVTKIFSPEDGQKRGLQGMINFMIRTCDFSPLDYAPDADSELSVSNWRSIASLVTRAEQKKNEPGDSELDRRLASCNSKVPVLGITGTGGAGKSSLTDELVRRFRSTFPTKSIAIFSIDPSRQKTGGALLGDRIRMNAIHHDNVYMRSLATRKSGSELSDAIQDAVKIARASQFDLIIVETSGIGQGDAQITEVADLTLYVMTSEFGAPSQLEKIDMLDYADFVAINKFDRRGSKDALRHVQKQMQRNQNLFHRPIEEMPVFGTMANQFEDEGINQLFRAIIAHVESKCGVSYGEISTEIVSRAPKAIIPPDRSHYLLDVVQTVRGYHKRVDDQAGIAERAYQLQGAKSIVTDESAVSVLDEALKREEEALDAQTKTILESWDEQVHQYQQDDLVTVIRGKERRDPLYTTSLSGTRIPRVSLPKFKSWGERVRFTMKENVPGSFPYTAGVFALKRTEEEPRRQFAGEGTPVRTNRRFHYLSKNDPAKRLSTAFDSVTLYGEDPDIRPDIYGKIGESGVSICTLDDMKKLYSGFDLCDPSTSVSMTINGPAPTILAMYLNTAIDQQVTAFEQEEGRKASVEEKSDIRARVLSVVRGTVQADILKEDQGQNTCIFSTEFALRMMGDIQAYFIENQVRNYYSVSISGYHIAEAGANPITQLALTLSNAFTYVEYYRSRGMDVNQFAPNLSFFFSNGMDPEYTVIGRVARRIWAIVMKELYNGNERSQKLKYHIQTSGRSLHAQEVDFNDIRTTLQALIAIYDNCNSLHTNAYDEAITTPTEESVRRAMAIQMIIQREFGLAKNENALQGSFIIEELTDLVEHAVLEEFLRIHERGGVLGAMETQYQRGKIQEESMYYEHLKHSGEFPIIGVNTFLKDDSSEGTSVAKEMELARATNAEKDEQIAALRAFQREHESESQDALERLKETARSGGNLFAALMETVRVASLGQITHALYEVGGKYRRNM